MDGNPTHLSSMSTRDRAQQIAALAGGSTALMDVAETTENPRWRLELCDHLIVLGQPAERLKAENFRKLAEIEINATARNTYIWAAKEIRKNQGEGE